jgi:hypothetical protein
VDPHRLTAGAPNVELVKRVRLEKSDPPTSDLGMLFLVVALSDVFAEHEVPWAGGRLARR